MRSERVRELSSAGDGCLAFGEVASSDSANVSDRFGALAEAACATFIADSEPGARTSRTYYAKPSTIHHFREDLVTSRVLTVEKRCKNRSISSSSYSSRSWTSDSSSSSFGDRRFTVDADADVPSISAPAGVGAVSESSSEPESEPSTTIGGAGVPPGLGGSGGATEGVLLLGLGLSGKADREEDEPCLEWCSGGGSSPPTCPW